MFNIGDEIVVYNNVDELIKLVKCYLGMEDERKRISNKAQKRAYKEHTYKQRIALLISKALG